MTIQGYMAELGYPEGYYIFCPDVWDARTSDPQISIYEAAIYEGLAQGPITTNLSHGRNYNIAGNINSCTIRAVGSENFGCAMQEACIARVSENGHITSCEDDIEDGVERNYQNSLCCEVVEDCTTMTDNTGDGFGGCASVQCHESVFTGFTPQECTGTAQTSSYCIENPEDCTASDDVVYYCSHGLFDDPNVQSQGFCCPAGTYAEYLDFVGWTCTESTECGIDPVLNECGFDINLDFEGWIDSNFEGNPQNWCYSALPELFSPISSNPSSSSAACCFVDFYGTQDYYIIQGNVRIFG